MKASVVGGALALLFVAPAHAQLFGPGKFKIERTADRFSTNGLANITGKNNRISKKSPAGGFYIDAGGIYLEPDAVIRQSDGNPFALTPLAFRRVDPLPRGEDQG